MGTLPLLLPQTTHSALYAAPTINDAIRRLIQENAQVFGQIVANLERLKVSC